jgi:hypothetical protein
MRGKLPTSNSQRPNETRAATLGVGKRELGVDGESLVNLQEIAEIELFIIKRLKEFTLGDHASVFKGSGFNFVGVRDWEPGDRL